MKDFAYVAPPPDGLQRAFKDARARRLRSAGLSTGTVAAGVAVLALVAGGQGTQSLVQQPSPQQPAVSRLVPDGTDPLPSAPRPNQGQAVQPYGTTQQGAVSAGGSQQRGTGTGGTATPPLQDRQVEPSSPGSHYAAGAITRDEGMVYLPSDTSCAVPSPGHAQETSLCSAASVGGGQSETSYQLYGEICSSRTNLTLLHYAGRNEVDMVITQKGQEVWRWSRWHPNGGAPHTIGLEGRSCMGWSFDWTGVGHDGRRLAKGTYSLKVTFLASEVAQKTAMTSFAVS